MQLQQMTYSRTTVNPLLTIGNSLKKQKSLYKVLTVTMLQHMHEHTHMHTHKNTHTHTHEHTHTHTHTHHWGAVLGSSHMLLAVLMTSDQTHYGKA